MRVDSNNFALNVKDFAIGFEHVCAIFTDNKVKCWGSNSTGFAGGVLGIGENNNALNIGDNANEMGASLDFTNVNIAANAEIIDFDAYSQTCILYQNFNENSNRLKCWGKNSSGQQGRNNTDRNGHTAESMGAGLLDIPMPNKPGEDFKINLESINLSLDYACGVDSYKQARCWGKDKNVGNLGEAAPSNTDLISIPGTAILDNTPPPP